MKPWFPYERPAKYDFSDFDKKLKVHKTIVNINNDLSTDEMKEFLSAHTVTELKYKNHWSSATLQFTVEELTLSNEPSVYTVYEVVDKAVSIIKKNREIELPAFDGVKITILKPYKMTIKVSREGADFNNYAEFYKQFKKTWRDIYIYIRLMEVTMKVYVVEYDFNVITVQGIKREPEHRVEHFTTPHDFIARVKQIHEATSTVHEAFGEKLNTNIKTYGGELKEIPLEKVLNPFGE